jgi:DNA-binding CsgD family transcriptional regulator
MTWLLTEREFETSAALIRDGDVTPELYAFVGRLVAANLRSGTVSPTLSPSGAWDSEAIADATHDWFAEKLIRGTLLLAFDRTATPQALARYLEQAFRNWLRDKARGRSWPRILIRARDILEGDERFKLFEDSSSWMARRWGLAVWARPPAIVENREVTDAVYQLPDLEIIRESGESGRAATILSTPDLERLLIHVLENLGGTISLSQLDRAFRHRFAWAFEAPTTGLEEVTEQPLATVDHASESIATETAYEILADLTRRQLEMLRERSDGATLEELAQLHGCSRGTADNELRRAGAAIRRHIANDELQERVLEILLTLSFSQRG